MCTDPGYDGELTVTSNNPSIVRVSSIYLSSSNSSRKRYTILKVFEGIGTATITVVGTSTSTYEGFTKTLLVTINKNTAPISYATKEVHQVFGTGSFTNPLTNNAGATVTYSSDDTSEATVDANTGLVTMVNGDVDEDGVRITATASETTYYTSGTASYTLYIQWADNTIAYSVSEVTKTYGDDQFTIALADNGQGSITYESNNTSVAIVNRTSGLVTIRGVGTATITATASGTKGYSDGTASYTLTVEEAASTTWSQPYLNTYGGKGNTTASYYCFPDGNTYVGESNATVTSVPGVDITYALQCGGNAWLKADTAESTQVFLSSQSGNNIAMWMYNIQLTSSQFTTDGAIMRVSFGIDMEAYFYIRYTTTNGFEVYNPNVYDATFSIYNIVHIQYDDNNNPYIMVGFVYDGASYFPCGLIENAQAYYETNRVIKVEVFDRIDMAQVAEAYWSGEWDNILPENGFIPIYGTKDPTGGYESNEEYLAGILGFNLNESTLDISTDTGTMSYLLWIETLSTTGNLSSNGYQYT